jgi:hypothetical protein
VTTGATGSGGSGTAGSAGESTAAGSSSEGVDESGGSGGSAGGSGSTQGSGGDSGATDGFDPGTICPDDYAAVCGVDGETYDNACTATAAGVEVRREGPCVGDCEGSCTLGGSPATLALALVALLVLRPRGGPSRSPGGAR